jgi:molecular chaperone GrpE
MSDEQKKDENQVAEPPKADENQMKDDRDAKIEELTNQLARAMADLQNYKRRSEEEKVSFVKFANAELLKIILPLLDNLDRSVTHLPEDLKGNEWTKGMLHIHEDLLKTFEKIGLKKIKTVGEKLDPKKHEALLAGPGEKDMVTEEFEAGYYLLDETIKPAKVKVGNGSK